MVNQLNKALEEVINTIINSDDYKSCVQLKEKMSTNKEICELVEKIKILQKKYVRENDEEVLEELKSLEGRLNEIPIYVIYMQHLENVNKMINYVKDELNEYFYKVLNDLENKQAVEGSLIITTKPYQKKEVHIYSDDLLEE